DSLYSRVVIADFALARYSSTTSSRLAELIQPLKGDILWLIGDEFADISRLRAVLNPGGKVIYHLHSVPFFQVGLKNSFHGNESDRMAYGKWFLLKHMREKLLHTYSRRYAKRTGITATEADAFVTLCNGYRRQLAGLYPAHASKFRAIYNPAGKPVEVNPADKRREVLYLGRLSFADKRVDRLLNIFAMIAGSHPAWKLRIVGDGPERSNLERQAAELGLENCVEFCGFSSNPAEYLKSASILCMTSEFEGWPMAIVEAMQYGVAPIAFGCTAGVRELLADGRGIAVKPGDIHSYALQLSQLMASPDLRGEIVGTHKPFLRELSISNIAAQWKELFLS
ncbi:MAG: glycosyltransferase, partial [Muribaculaceae bacterium]|nr:glycosyltransferase [Muribaculaceae bacterium]